MRRSSAALLLAALLPGAGGTVAHAEAQDTAQAHQDQAFSIGLIAFMAQGCGTLDPTTVGAVTTAVTRGIEALGQGRGTDYADRLRARYRDGVMLGQAIQARLACSSMREDEIRRMRGIAAGTVKPFQP